VTQIAGGTQFGKHALADRKNDLYETPPCATRALIPFLDRDRVIWEPACGPGAIVRELEAAGFGVHATDLVHYGLDGAFGGIDFLMERPDRWMPDVIVTNPPYIPTRHLALLQPEVRAEPRQALDGGSDGLDAYRQLVPAMPGLLHPGGGVVIEVGVGQTEAVNSLLLGTGFPAPGLARDLSARARALFALYPKG
jgi:hypothetical protein